MTEANIEAVSAKDSTFAIALFLFERILYIYYSMGFKKNLAKIQTLLDSDSEVNNMTSIYTAKLNSKI